MEGAFRAFVISSPLPDDKVSPLGNSLERIEQYTHIEQEPTSTTHGQPPASWPTSGHLSVENLFARYSDDRPDVLHEITFQCASGEKVGIGQLINPSQTLATRS